MGTNYTITMVIVNDVKKIKQLYVVDKLTFFLELNCLKHSTHYAKKTFLIKEKEINSKKKVNFVYN